jgi:hypothetical protein
VLRRDAAGHNAPGLYGAGSGLAAPGNQQFWQGTGGLTGLAEASDVFSSGLIGSDQ